MPDKKLYLKPNVVIEPLVDNWYAWSHLISPATAAMNITGRHLSIMQSYLSNPSIHAEAVLNPKFKGGPFMDFGGGRVEEVKQLHDETVKKRYASIAFAEAIKQLDRLLEEKAEGQGLEAIYSEVPSILKGYVELFYDRNNHPAFRFFEPLLYDSEFYDKSSQSIALWITDNDHRPFCLTTPRISNDNILQLPVSFDHKGIDELAKMKRVPQTLNFIKSVLPVKKEHEEMFNSFFTDEPLPVYKPYTGDKIRMRYFGHACILIETSDINILIDPLISYYGYESTVNHYSDIDLPDVIDYVLITHNHQDHILLETLLPLRHKIKKLIVPATYGGRLEDPDLKLMFEHIGFDNVLSIGEMETIQFKDAAITGLPFTGEHSDLNILTKSCYLVKIGDFKLLFFADSRVLEPEVYRHIQRRIGNVDVIFVGMECDGAPLSWLYGSLLTRKISRKHDQSRRLAGSDCEKAMTLVNIFSPREVYVYAMGMEPWLEFISSITYTDESNPIIQSSMLLKQCEARGIIAERLFGEKELLYEKQEA